MPKNIFRNGTKSRESLPLRNEENRNQPPKGLQEETQGICPTATAPNHGNHCRCGTRKIETSRQKACRKRRKESARPQRHRITEIAAVVERGKSKPSAKRPAGRNARNLPDRNGTKSRESLPLRNEANRKTTSKRPAGWEHKDTQAGQVLPEHLAKVYPKGRKTVHLCNWAMPGTPIQALWQWSRQLAAAKVYPKGGKTVHLCNWAMPETPPQALWLWSGPHDAAKVYPKGGKTVHLCNRAMPETPIQALWQWSGPHAAAKVYPKGGKTVHLCNRAMPGTPPQAL